MPQVAVHGQVRDPYRVFFPLGILLGIAGVSVWPLYYYGITDGFSGRSHAFIQIYGFLYSFISGFLLTAIPRFTGTQSPSRLTQYLLAAIITISAVAFEMQSFAIGHAAFVAAHILLISLAARRFVHRKHNPPETFALVGTGVLTGALAAVMNALVAWEWIGPEWDPLGKRLLTEGMMLMLVLGIGGFLGPRLMGFAEVPKRFDQFSAPAHRIRLYAAAGVTLLLTLIAEYGFGITFMAYVRAAVASATVISTVRPWRLPAVRTTLSWTAWTAFWMLVCGVWLAAIAPRYRVDFLHILFMGTFTVLILAVGTRVTLSHGGHPLSKERRSWPLRIGVVAVMGALIARVGAPFAPFTYFSHLSWGALLWIAGIAFWGMYLIRLLGGGNRGQAT